MADFSSLLSRLSLILSHSTASLSFQYISSTSFLTFKDEKRESVYECFKAALESTEEEVLTLTVLGMSRLFLFKYTDDVEVPFLIHFVS